MKTTIEKENGMVRVIMDFMGYEKPTVAEVLRSLLSDYRRSFDAICFQRDTKPYETGNGYYAEFYIRESDEIRLRRLLRKVV